MNRVLSVGLALLVASALDNASAFAQQPAVAVPVPVQSKPVLGRGVVVTGSPAPQGFSVVLVLGEMQGNGATDSVPAAARKALADMKDFLPYKSYRFLDTQWTLCCGRSPTVTRLRGPDEQDYDLELSPGVAAPDGKWAVRFALREPVESGAPNESASSSGSADSAKQKRELESQMQTINDLQRRLQILREQYSEGHVEAQRLKAQISQLERELEAERARVERSSAAERVAAGRFIKEMRPHGRAIIDTSFTMEIGETVVVGTSRLKGDKALIALLTAVPSSKTPAR
jgi:hypothetical protein